MKLFGYEEGNNGQEQPMRLSEASILTNPGGAEGGRQGTCRSGR